MIVVDPTNLPLKFGQNRVRNSWNIDDIEFVVVVVVGGGSGGGGLKSFSCHTQLLSWVELEFGLFQFCMYGQLASMVMVNMFNIFIRANLATMSLIAKRVHTT